jgi:hypothetical protein
MFFNMYVFECPFLRRVRLTQIIKENSGFFVWSKWPVLKAAEIEITKQKKIQRLGCRFPKDF